MTPIRYSALAAASAILLVACSTWTFAQDKDKSSGDDFSAGIEVRPNASVTEIGLPLYPGALRRRDKGEDSPAITLGLWGGSLGLKLYVIKYRSRDPIDSIADFYVQAMQHYGAVLDCSGSDGKTSLSSDRHGLECDDGHPGPGERVYKVGTKSDQRIVSLKPAGSEVYFELVHLRLRGD